MIKELLILVLICKVIPSKGEWNEEANVAYGCRAESNKTDIEMYYRETLHGLCFKKPYRIHLCTNCSDLNMTLNQFNVINIDLKKQILTIKTEYTLTWFDDRIVWGIEGVKFVLATQAKNVFWMPVLNVHHSIDEKLHGEKLMVNNGQMIYVKTATYEITCPMNFKDFPFDDQNCPFEVIVVHNLILQLLHITY